MRTSFADYRIVTRSPQARFPVPVETRPAKAPELSWALLQGPKAQCHGGHVLPPSPDRDRAGRGVGSRGVRAAGAAEACERAGTAATQVGGTWAKATPEAEPRYTGGKWIEVTYGRPVLRGRTAVFGTGADYGKKVSDGVPVWRAGANLTTRFATEVPLVFGGKTLAAGEYSCSSSSRRGPGRSSSPRTPWPAEIRPKREGG